MQQNLLRKTAPPCIPHAYALLKPTWQCICFARSGGFHGNPSRVAANSRRDSNRFSSRFKLILVEIQLNFQSNLQAIQCRLRGKTGAIEGECRPPPCPIRPAPRHTRHDLPYSFCSPYLKILAFYTYILYTIGR